jgi:hypothetical protein
MSLPRATILSMRPEWQFQLVEWLTEAGLSGRRISRTLGFPLATVQKWRQRIRDGLGPPGSRQGRRGLEAECPRCGPAPLNERAYAYLLGMYLGDGYIVRQKGKRFLYALWIYAATEYPGIMAECEQAMRAMRPMNLLN